MEVGLQLIFSSYGCDDSVTDAQVYAEELGLAKQAERLGFDTLWPVERSFHVQD